VSWPACRVEATVQGHAVYIVMSDGISTLLYGMRQLAPANAWRTRGPPAQLRTYHQPMKTANLPEILIGGCLCGCVRFEVHAPVLKFVACRCSRCRKSSGSSHATNLAVPPHQFVWLSGEASVKRFELPTATRFGRCFCGVCGAPVPRLARDGELVIVPAGAIETEFQLTAEQLHTGSAAAWDPLGT